MSGSENPWGQWYPRIRDDGFIRARYSETHLGNSEYQHLDADYLNALEATITTLKAQLEAAEGKAALAESVRGRSHTVWLSDFLDEFDRRYDALSAPASDTGSEEGNDAARD